MPVILNYVYFWEESEEVLTKNKNFTIRSSSQTIINLKNAASQSNSDYGRPLWYISVQLISWPKECEQN